MNMIDDLRQRIIDWLTPAEDIDESAYIAGQIFSLTRRTKELEMKMRSIIEVQKTYQDRRVRGVDRDQKAYRDQTSRHVRQMCLYYLDKIGNNASQHALISQMVRALIETVERGRLPQHVEAWLESYIAGEHTPPSPDDLTDDLDRR